MARLNNFLESFRAKVNAKYGKRKKTSDGTLGDQAHKARVSEHNADSDGTIDAWDMDVNLLGGNSETGSAAEKAEVWKVIQEFMKQPQAQLVIWDEHIYNRDIGNWKKRYYGNWKSGKNPHDHHVHFQSKQSREDQKYTGKGLDTVVNAQPVKAPTKPVAKPANPPKKEVKKMVYVSDITLSMQGETVKLLQEGLNKVFPSYSKLKVDSMYGPESVKVVKEFQKRSNLDADGIVGKLTQDALAKHGIYLRK